MPNSQNNADASATESATTSQTGPIAAAATTSITPQQHYNQSIRRSKEPAVVAAEKYMAFLLHHENAEEVVNALDPAITFISPVAYYRGRPVVKSWMQFEAKTMIPFQPYARLNEIKSDDEMKCATILWSLGGLHFEDKINLSHLLQYQTIQRKMTRSYNNLDEKLISEEFLRLLTGPHFLKHCEPKEGSIDNAALVLPTLDYSHLGLRDFKQLLATAPSAASTSRPVTDMNIVYHFMSEALVKAQIEAEKQKEASEEKTRKTNFSSAKGRGEQFVIKASNREGEKKVLVIDKADFFRSSQASRVEQMQDDEVTGIATRHDRPRYLCSCVRLRNNFFGAKEGEEFDSDGKLIEPSADELGEGNGRGGKANAKTSAADRLAGVGGFSSSSLTPVTGKRGRKEDAAAELGTVLKLLVMNAFYFVTNIDLSSNKLTTIPDLSELPLVGLSLHDNRLSSWEDLEQKLKPLKLLQNLTLFANPIQKEAASVKDYKYSVLSLFFIPDGRSMRDPPRGPLTGGGGRRSGQSADGRSFLTDQNRSSASFSNSSSPFLGGGGGTTSSKAPRSLNISSSYYASAASSSAPSSSPLPPLRHNNNNNNTTASSGGGGVEERKGESGGGELQRTALVRSSGGGEGPSTHTRSSSALAFSASTAAPSASSRNPIISLRFLDHSIVSPKEVDIVKTFIKTFEAKRARNVKLEKKLEKAHQLHDNHHSQQIWKEEEKQQGQGLSQQRQHVKEGSGTKSSAGDDSSRRGPAGAKSVASLREKVSSLRN